MHLATYDGDHRVVSEAGLLDMDATVELLDGGGRRGGSARGATGRLGTEGRCNHAQTCGSVFRSSSRSMPDGVTNPQVARCLEGTMWRWDPDNA